MTIGTIYLGRRELEILHICFFFHPSMRNSRNITYVFGSVRRRKLSREAREIADHSKMNGIYKEKENSDDVVNIFSSMH